MKKTVLIVEDNELNMKLFNDLLEAHGYKTLQTGNGMEALELARAHARPDPDGHPAAGGLGARSHQVAEGGRRAQGIPVVAVTAFAMKGDEERIREGGCEAYLSKPISVAKFLATVRTFSASEAHHDRPRPRRR